MSEWYGVPATVVSEKTARTRPDEPQPPESEAEAPPSDRPAPDE